MCIYKRTKIKSMKTTLIIENEKRMNQILTDAASKCVFTRNDLNYINCELKIQNYNSLLKETLK